MLIGSGGGGGAQGFIGIGNNLATNFVPQQRLHLHQGNDNNDNFIRWSNGDIGNMTGLDIGPRTEKKPKVKELRLFDRPRYPRPLKGRPLRTRL